VKRPVQAAGMSTMPGAFLASVRQAMGRVIGVLLAMANS
jgi:hypothetical protein